MISDMIPTPTKPSDIERRKRLIATGKSLSQSGSLIFEAPRPDYLWLVKFSLPFSWAGSKNYAFSNSRNGGWKYRTQQSKQFEESITVLTKSAMRGVKVVQNKVWIGFVIEKASHKGDAINFLDVIADGIKKAIGVDDRWFSVAFIDWRVNKSDPKIFIQVGQDSNVESQICSACGRIQPKTNFSIRKHNKSGVARVCIECTETSKSPRRKKLEAA